MAVRASRPDDEPVPAGAEPLVGLLRLAADEGYRTHGPNASDADVAILPQLETRSASPAPMDRESDPNPAS